MKSYTRKMKRIVRLKNKNTGEIDSYPTLIDLVRRNGEKTLGIGLSALYNAVSKNKGQWENHTYVIYYETINLGVKHWE